MGLFVHRRLYFHSQLLWLACDAQHDHQWLPAADGAYPRQDTYVSTHGFLISVVRPAFCATVLPCASCIAHTDHCIEDVRRIGIAVKVMSTIGLLVTILVLALYTANPKLRIKWPGPIVLVLGLVCTQACHVVFVKDLPTLANSG